MKLVFVHGWGSSTMIWDKMLPHFKDHECHVVNLGFSGEENIDIPEDKFIGIGHSLGGLWLLKHYPEQMSGFVSIASFNCFHEHTSQQVLNLMEKNIAKDMVKEIKNFWHIAGLNQDNGLLDLNPLKLIEGLHWLGKWKAKTPENLPMLNLASCDDRVVSEQMSTDLWESYNLKWCDNGGHMLPLTQDQWCVKNIKEFISHVK